MTKELLLHEYMLLERKNETLEEKLEFMRGQEEEKARRGLVDYNFANGEYPMDPENAEKIKIFQAEIGRLQRENERLHLENSTIKETLTGRLLDHNSSSSDSSSSSSSSSDSSSSSEDEDEEDSKECKGMQGRPEDTGYESTQSKEPTPPLRCECSLQVSAWPAGETTKFLSKRGSWLFALGALVTCVLWPPLHPLALL